jgi:hypothetical protein
MFSTVVREGIEPPTRGFSVPVARNRPRRRALSSIPAPPTTHSSPPMSSPLRRTAAAAAVATALSLSAATQAQAQRRTTFPSDNPAIKRIWQIGKDSPRVEALGQAILDSIGPRLTSSPGMTSASDWAIAQFKSWGIDAKRENYGTWRGWRRGVSHIDFVALRTRSLEGTMLAWSPSTKGKPMKAEAIILGSAVIFTRTYSPLRVNAFVELLAI